MNEGMSRRKFLAGSAGATGAMILYPIFSDGRSHRPPPPTTTTTSTSTTTTTTTTTPTTTAPPHTGPQLLLTMGDNIAGYQASPWTGTIHGIQHWFNGPGDVGWNQGYTASGIMSYIYQSGRFLDVIMYFGGGGAATVEYGVSPQFLNTDLPDLIRTWTAQGQANPAPIYITMYTEIETYDTTVVSTAQVVQAFTQAVTIVHDTYPFAQVGLGLGGYDWFGPTPNLSAFEPAMAAADWVGTQMMDPDDEWQQLADATLAAVSQLKQYSKPIHLTYVDCWPDASDGGMHDQDYIDYLSAVFPTVGADVALWGFRADGLQTQGSALFNHVQQLAEAYQA